MTVSVGGQRLEATAIDTVTTPTGTWPVSDLGAVSGGRVYQFGLSSRPSWWSICIVRYPVPGDTTVGERIYPVSISGVDVKVSVLGGSMKCVDNGEPVAPSMARIREAVAAKRVLPYSSAAFSGWPTSPKLEAERKEYNLLGYQPGRVYGRSSSNNSIGVVSGQGGEYGSSRGFISGDDAVMIAAALAGNETVFKDAAEQNRIQTLYGLSLPYLAIWSPAHDLLRDPQVPLPGDAPYFNEGTAGERYNAGRWCVPLDYPYAGALEATPGQCYAHGRDEAHLFNHGYAYWLATGDPRAALLQQAIAAYMLASNYLRVAGKYNPRFAYQRTTLNQFSALWKLRDVSLNASTANGTILWSKARTDKMSADMWASWKGRLAQQDAGTLKSPSGALVPGQKATSIFRGIDSNPDNAYNSFMIQAYGPEAAYLWASAGRPELLTRIAENMVLRFGKIGGARGYAGRLTGSGFPIMADGVTPYADEAGFVAWVNATATTPNSTFNGAPAHYVMRSYWSLRLARDAVRRGWLAPVSGLDDAVAKTETARAATTQWASTATVDWKHAGVTFD